MPRYTKMRKTGHGRRTQEAELAGDGGEDEVCLDLGDSLGEALAETRAGDAAVGNVEDALGDLEPRIVGVGPGSSQVERAVARARTRGT